MVLVTLIILGSMIWGTILICTAIRIYASESQDVVIYLGELMNKCVHKIDRVPVKELDAQYDEVVTKVMIVENSQWVMLASCVAFFAFFMIFFFCIECGSYYYDNPESWWDE